MVEVTSQQGAVLAFVSVATLGFVSAICLGCRKKSRFERFQFFILNGTYDTHSNPYPSNLLAAIFGTMEPTYVHPIPTPPYKSPPDELTDNDADGGAYENVFPTKDIDHDSADSYDYENAPFQNNRDDDDETDEPDYVNASVG
ncbi:hypothetical protein NFI96_026100 [Prochilodus magdalenae]|nr:hypothetical protein NFI96_026100 [Prochilodus magdalenae]